MGYKLYEAGNEKRIREQIRIILGPSAACSYTVSYINNPLQLTCTFDKPCGSSHPIRYHPGSIEDTASVRQTLFTLIRS